MSIASNNKIGSEYIKSLDMSTDAGCVEVAKHFQSLNPTHKQIIIDAIELALKHPGFLEYLEQKEDYAPDMVRAYMQEWRMLHETDKY